MSAEICFILSQLTRLTDRQTDAPRKDCVHTMQCGTNQTGTKQYRCVLEMIKIIKMMNADQPAVSHLCCTYLVIEVMP